MNKIIYIFCSILIILYILLVLYIKLSHPFWFKQPVNHLHAFYNVFRSGVIRKNLPCNNKYCDHLHITTIQEKDLDDNIIDKIVTLIQKHYLVNKDVCYKPTKDTIMNYLINHNIPSYITTYQVTQKYIEKNEIKITNNVLGVITGRPLLFHSKYKDISFNMYYVDFLCVNTKHRGKNIAPKLIQTHEYNARRNNQTIMVSFFKRESDITFIKPFVQYTCTMFKNDFPVVELHNQYSYVIISKDNFDVYIHFMKNVMTEIPYYITCDHSNLLTLINSKQIIIYAVIIQNTIIHLYFFKNGDYYYENELAIECFASVSGSDKLNFNNHFLNILHLLPYKYLYLEHISNNETLSTFIKKYNNTEFITKASYYFYNYFHKTVSSKDVLIII